MTILSSIKDYLLDSYNILCELTIGEYLRIGEHILNSNVYQRSRVKKASSVYSLLNNDIKHRCTIPTIVLAINSEIPLGEAIAHLTEEDLLQFLSPENTMILDGLQRTYTLRDVRDELSKGSPEQLQQFLEHKLRIEVYLGISKTGILYRMLTLNTGQTPMSRRHEIEILYSDYLARDLEPGIKFNRQASNEQNERVVGVYDFDDAIEGFNSYIEGSEFGITKESILSTVQQLERVSADDYKKDLFKQFIHTYTELVKKVDTLTDHWSFGLNNSKMRSCYGKNIPSIMNKSQTISGFGAAVSSMSDKSYALFQELEKSIAQLSLGAGADETMMHLLKTLDNVRQSAKKIGVAQRIYMRAYFKCLLSPESDTYLNIYQSILTAEEAYKLIGKDESIIRQ